MKIYLATDHAGFEIKEAIKLYLETEKEELIKALLVIGISVKEIEVIDMGAYDYDPKDDYPEFISSAASTLSSDIYLGQKENRAIILGGSGEGEAMVADKYKGIRAGVINREDMELVKLLRVHNDANIISFGARFISKDFALAAVKTFLTTKFIAEKEDGEDTRHERRIKEINKIEENLEDKVSPEDIDTLSMMENIRNRVKDN